jgi:hypothetical protein
VSTAGHIGTDIGEITCTALLLQRAYIAHRHNRALLVFGVNIILSRLGFCFVIWNTILFLAFIHVTLQLYCRLGTKSWKKLARDGITTMLLVGATHILCTVLIASNLANKPFHRCAGD